MPFLLQNSFLAILMLISQKPVQRRVIGKKMRFFRWPSKKGQNRNNYETRFSRHGSLNQ